MDEAKKNESEPRLVTLSFIWEDGSDGEKLTVSSWHHLEKDVHLSGDPNDVFRDLGPEIRRALRERKYGPVVNDSPHSFHSQMPPGMPPRPHEPQNTLYCSFCGKSQHEVTNMIAGPTVFICNECVALCTELVGEKVQDIQPPAKKEKRQPHHPVDAAAFRKHLNQGYAMLKRLERENGGGE
jgi:hypothetical protein